MNMKKLVAAAMLMAAVGGASAQVYVGGAYGLTQFSVDCAGTSTCDKTDTGFKLYAGYQLNPIWSVEAGYINFGKVKYTYWDGVNVDGKLKTSAFTLAAAGRGAFTPSLAGVFRLGIANVKTEGTESALGISLSDSQTKVKPYLGLGLEYGFTKDLKGTLGADFTQGEIGNESGSVRAFNLGVQYGF